MDTRKNILKKIYFQNRSDRNLKEFTTRFLSSGLLWVYIGLNSKKRWKRIFKTLNADQKAQFIREYNKAFLLSNTYKEFTKLCLGKTITLKNLFLPHSAGKIPESFTELNRSDHLRWKEVLDLSS